MWLQIENDCIWNTDLNPKVEFCAGWSAFYYGDLGAVIGFLAVEHNFETKLMGLLKMVIDGEKCYETQI
jgi:hypothetical protein